jgi:hypothetical protein
LAYATSVVDRTGQCHTLSIQAFITFHQLQLTPIKSKTFTFDLTPTFEISPIFELAQNYKTTPVIHRLPSSQRV